MRRSSTSSPCPSAGACARAPGAERQTRSSSDQPPCPGCARARSQPARSTSSTWPGAAAGATPSSRASGQQVRVGSLAFGPGRGPAHHHADHARVLGRQRRAGRGQHHLQALAPQAVRAAQAAVAAAQRSGGHAHGALPRAGLAQHAARGVRLQVVEHLPDLRVADLHGAEAGHGPPAAAPVHAVAHTPEQLAVEPLPQQAAGEHGRPHGQARRVGAFAARIHAVAARAQPHVDGLAAHDALGREAGGRAVQAGGHGGRQQQLRQRPGREQHQRQRRGGQPPAHAARAHQQRRRQQRHGQQHAAQRERHAPRVAAVDRQHLGRQPVREGPRGLARGLAREPQRMQRVAQRELRGEHRPGQGVEGVGRQRQGLTSCRPGPAARVRGGAARPGARRRGGAGTAGR